MQYAGPLTEPFFEPLPQDSSCPYCNGSLTVPERVLDAVYCISLQEEPERFREAAKHLHAVGLCRHVIFYRARRDHEPPIGCWTSTREVAREALAQGHASVLILEDDVHFTTTWVRIAERLRDALGRLPPDWRALYLGHKPFWAYTIERGLIRTSSYLTHAVVTNRPLLEWLANTRPGDPTIPSDHPYKDPAYRVMVGMYALFPMVAKQRIPPANRRWRPPPSPTHLVNWYFVRMIEVATVAMSPFYRWRDRRRVPAIAPYFTDTPIAIEARMIEASGLFDPDYYLATYPEVRMDALRHFMWDGAREGKRPNPDFDTLAYRATHPDLGRENPLAHFIRTRPGS